MRLVQEGTVSLPLPMEAAMRLFTPEGEREWVPGWDPDYGDEGPSERQGTFFKTSAHEVETLWLINELDMSAGRAAYSRFTPGRHAGIVSIRCEATSSSTSDVHVTYDMTLLPGADPSHMSGYRGHRFVEMMSSWKEMLTDCLSQESSNAR